jgi:hypothetical protein
MNCKEWHTLKVVNPELLNWGYYNKTRKIQKSLQYNNDQNATVIHHLRDTEEQRKYNDEHYELWGFEIDEDGNEHFEYGKYVVFWTKEAHSKYHTQSEETRQKISESNKANYTDERRKKVSATHKGKHASQETRQKLSEAARHRPPVSDETRHKLSQTLQGENNGMYGKHHTEESKKKMSENKKGKCTGKDHWLYGKQMSSEYRQKLSESHIGNIQSDETKRKISESNKKSWENNDSRRLSFSEKFSGENNPNFGKCLTDEEKQHISETQRKLWSDDAYRQKMIKSHLGHKASDSTKQKMSEAHKDKMRIIKSLYKTYKESGGPLKWNEFQKYIKDAKDTKSDSEGSDEQ